MTAHPIAILGGTGPQGRGLALRFARAGVPVVIGSRDGAKAEETARALRAGSDLPVIGAANPVAAAAGDVVFIAVPWAAHEATLRSLTNELAGRIVVDLVNPLEFDKQGPKGLHVPEGSAAQQAQALLPSCRVVSGFHHISAKLLLDESTGVDTDILVCGDDLDAKQRVLDLAALIPGARALDAGPLRLAGWLEGLTAVLLSINRRYHTSAGIHLTRIDGTHPQI